ncbi:MAG: hypothetical protein ACKVKL_15410 [Pseudomonadales bacterium]|jgi:hypothetical protein|tara:strand:- start:19772 stop:19972 length:201 start_codon:yes stop_codon:yes gene_type:complete
MNNSIRTEFYSKNVFLFTCLAVLSIGVEAAPAADVIGDTNITFEEITVTARNGKNPFRIFQWPFRS